MKLNKLMVTLALLLLAPVMAWGQEGGMRMPKIPIDTSVRIGKLPNGLTYYIRHNGYPEHRANFYIAQRVGSIQEEENQRGLAHFLEHMAFNGSDHFKGNNLIEYTRSIGVEFGANLNAYTSIDRTVYNITEVPTTRQSSVDSCLLILKDWSNGLTLDAKEIDKERGVIHEEWRLRTSASQRMFERNLETLYPGSKYGKRMPIGLMSVVDNFKPKALRDYYHKWYRPDNQALIIVGDVDVDHIEAEVKKLFGGITVPANAAKVVDEPVPDNAKPIVVIDKDKEMRYSIVELMFKHEAVPDSDKTSLAYMLQQYATYMATYMLNQRLQEKAQEPDCPFTQASCSDGEYIYAKTKDALEFSALPKEGQTAQAVKSIAEEAYRAVQHGFTDTEYARARSEYLSQLEKQYENRNKTKNDNYCQEYIENYLQNEPIPGIDFEYQAMNQIVPNLPVALVNQLMKELVSQSDSNIVIMNFNQEKDGAVYPTQQQLLDALEQARGEKLDAYVDNVKNEPLVTELPKPGKITSEKDNKEFGYKDVVLSNGARVILKKTDFKDDEVLFMAISRGGTSLYGPADYANLDFFNYATSYSGLGKFSNQELTKQLAGKQASMGLMLNDNTEYLTGTSTPKDLATMFQLLYLNMTDISKDQKSYDNLVSLFETVLKNRAISPDEAFSDSVTVTLNNHNLRYAPFTVDMLKTVNYDRILQIAKERTANAADFTYFIVGNFNEDSVRQYICQYIGSLPGDAKKRENWKDVFDRPTGTVINQFERKMETPKANARMYWYNTKTPLTLDNSVKADAAGQILDMIYLKKIREDASAAYSAGGAGYQNKFGDHVVTTLVGVCPMKPEKKDLALKIMRDVVGEMAKGIDAAQLAKVKEAMIKNYDTNVRENRYWLNTLNELVRYGYDPYTNYKAAVNALTPAAVSQFVKDNFTGAASSVQVIMLPDASSKEVTK